MNTIRLACEGLRMYRRHLRVRGKNHTRYAGSAKDICEAILEDLWNGTFYQTSKGNYPQFYARDFGMALDALIARGHKESARKTLAYALERYKKAGRVTTHLTPKGKAVSFPNAYSPDSFAYLLRSVRVLGDKKLLRTYKEFLQREANRFAKQALDSEGKVKRGKHLVGMRDHAIRDASCYDTVMAAVVQRECKELGLHFAHEKTDYKQVLLDDYWTGAYFKDDMSKDTLTADANIYPFWHGIITDKKLLQKAVKSMQQAGLDKPFPIKYVATKKEKGKTIIWELFSKDWEADNAWPMSAMPYIDILSKIDRRKAAFHHDQYKRLIEEYGTFIEVYDRNGKPYHSAFYSADEAMIWAAMWLHSGKA